MIFFSFPEFYLTTYNEFPGSDRFICKLFISIYWYISISHISAYTHVKYVLITYCVISIWFIHTHKMLKWDSLSEVWLRDKCSRCLMPLLPSVIFRSPQKDMPLNVKAISFILAITHFTHKNVCFEGKVVPSERIVRILCSSNFKNGGRMDFSHIKPSERAFREPPVISWYMAPGGSSLSN